MRLGAYVWYGFSYEGGHYTDRLYNEFSDREPIWGWTEDSLENMRYQISLAEEYGLSFFSFDWYYGSWHLNKAVDKFIEVRGDSNIEFCLMVGNHGSAHIYRDRWEDACNYFLKYMTSPGALKLDGKPVIVIYDITSLIEDLGGIDEAKRCLLYLRELVRNEAGTEIIIYGCECPYGTPETGAIDFNFEAFTKEELKTRLLRDRECGFDALTGYNYRRYSPINGSYELTFKEMTEHHEKSWDAMSDMKIIPYSPCILAGWDCRPWETDWWGNRVGYRSCYAPDRTGKVLTEHIKNAACWIENNPDVQMGELCFIYAWDEVCEGGFLIPTKGEGFKMLDGLKDAVKNEII